MIGTPNDRELSVIQEGLEELQQGELLGSAIDQGQQDCAEVALQ